MSNNNGHLKLKLKGDSILRISKSPPDKLAYTFKYIILAKDCDPIDPMANIYRQ
jgi:hypothetical protein